MLRAVLPALPLACVLACSDDGPAPIEYVEHCGATGPTRILELGPGQARGSSRVIGDRTYHTIGRIDLDNSFGPALTDWALWSSGPCGESPVHLADDVFLPFTLDRWPDLPLICLDGTGVVALDPLGAQPPRTIFALPDCHVVGASDHGLLSFTNLDEDSELADLQLTAYPEDPHELAPAPITIATQVRFGMRQLVADAIYVIQKDATLVRIDLADHESTPVQTDVLLFAVSPDERYLVWQAASAPFVSLRDNTSGTSFGLGTTEWLFFDLNLAYLDDGILIFGDRLFYLPDLTVVDLPSGNQVSYMAPDRSFVLVSPPHGAGLRRVDLDDRTTTTLFRREAQIVGGDDEAVLVHDLPICCLSTTEVDEGEVWRVRFDGSAAYPVADRATRYRWLPNPTDLVTIVDIADDYLGTLIHIDTAARHEQVIDDHVFASYPHETDPSVITYSVNDGPRSGVYTFRIATTP